MLKENTCLKLLPVMSDGILNMGLKDIFNSVMVIDIYCYINR